MKYIYAALTLLMISACSSSIPENTVMITNLESTSGGSGSIIQSTDQGSLILTNAHVCGVVKGGGIVHAMSVDAAVMSYKLSKTHDLCVIKVLANLKAKAVIAKSLPVPFEPSLVSGHPRLIPTIMTPGHFSGHKMIQVMTGVKECTEADRSNPATALFCAILGKIPVITTYDAVAVSSLIQPGSSGSAVYTSRNEIGAVVFAGGGEISFGFAVPLEYVKSFLADLSKIPTEYPNSKGGSSDDQKPEDFIQKAIKICNDKENYEQAKTICSNFKNSLRYSDLIERK